MNSQKVHRSVIPAQAGMTKNLQNVVFEVYAYLRVRQH